MSLNIINIYFGIKYLENSNFKNTIFFLFSGLSIGTRLWNLPSSFIFIFKAIQILRTKIKSGAIFKYFYKFNLTLIFIYIFFSYLFNPITNFEAFLNKQY